MKMNIYSNYLIVHSVTGITLLVFFRDQLLVELLLDVGWSAIRAFRLLLQGVTAVTHGCLFVHWTAIWAKSGQLTLAPPRRSSE